MSPFFALAMMMKRRRVYGSSCGGILLLESTLSIPLFSSSIRSAARLTGATI